MILSVSNFNDSVIYLVLLSIILILILYTNCVFWILNLPTIHWIKGSSLVIVVLNAYPASQYAIGLFIVESPNYRFSQPFYDYNPRLSISLLTLRLAMAYSVTEAKSELTDWFT